MAEQEVKEERKMLPEVLAYFVALDAAEVAFEKGRRDLSDQFPQRLGYGRAARKEQDAFDRVEGKLHDDRQAARTAAWAALKESSDPLVKWIAQNCRDYRDHAETILRALPATEAELNDIAESGEWCEVWDGFKERAIEAGVMPGFTPPTPAVRAVLDFMTHDVGLRRSYRPRVRELLAAVVKEAQESATETATIAA